MPACVPNMPTLKTGKEKPMPRETARKMAGVKPGKKLSLRNMANA